MSINGIRIAHLTQHWRRIEGVWYRDAWALNPDGSLRPVSILDEMVSQ